MKIDEIASIVIMNPFGSIKVSVWELLEYIDNNMKAMNNEFAKFAANKKIHLNFISKGLLNLFLLEISVNQVFFEVDINLCDCSTTMTAYKRRGEVSIYRRVHWCPFS
jgi:hypothetical protein